MACRLNRRRNRAGLVRKSRFLGEKRREPGFEFTVAVDGPAAAGKGTVARAIAEEFGFSHLDTGLLYRAVARKLIDSGLPGDSKAAEKFAARINAGDLRAQGLRSNDVSALSSRVAAIPSVRFALLDFQRRYARRPGGAVLDGRDIGTVICPNAEVKLYVTASLERRAERRQRELQTAGEIVAFEEVSAELKKRDERDRRRQFGGIEKGVRCGVD